MAKFKIWMVALTLIMGVSFTSCMNSDNDTTMHRGALAKVYSMYGMSYYFKTAEGITITPTATSVAELEARGFKFSEVEGQVVQISYQWDSSVLEIPDNATKIEGVALTGIVSLDSQVEVVDEPGAANDSISDTPIISLKKEVSSTFAYEPYYFDTNTLMLPINYYIQTKPHSFTLVYYPNEETTDGTIKLYLRHRKSGDNMNTGSPTSFDYAYNGSTYLYYRSFNLQKIAYSTSGSLDKVIVVAEENSSSVDLKDTSTKTNEYTVEYKEIK